MHVLVTGGAGFIGAHSVVELANHGHRCTVIDDLSAGSSDGLGAARESVDLVTASILDQRALDEASRGCTAILHLAAQVSVVESLRDPARSAATNILGFVNVLELARQRGCRVVYASSAAVYGGSTGRPCHEADPVRPQSPYGLEKATCEAYARLYEDLYDLPSLGLRYFNVYGPGQAADSPYAAVIAAFVQRVRDGQPPIIYGDGRQTRDFIAVEDVARANRLALEADARGVLNVASGAAVTLLDLIETLSTLTGKPITPIHAAARPGDVRMSAAAVDRAARMLGFEATVSLPVGLRRLLEEPPVSPAGERADAPRGRARS